MLDWNQHLSTHCLHSVHSTNPLWVLPELCLVLRAGRECELWQMSVCCRPWCCEGSALHLLQEQAVSLPPSSHLAPGRGTKSPSEYTAWRPLVTWKWQTAVWPIKENIRGHSHRHDCYSFYSCEQPWLTLLFLRDSSSFEVLLTSCYLQFFFNLLTMLVKHNLILHSFTLVNTGRSGSTNSYFLSFCQLKEHYKINKYIYTILCHHGQNMDHWVLKLSFIINN